MGKVTIQDKPLEFAYVCLDNRENLDQNCLANQPGDAW